MSTTLDAHRLPHSITDAELQRPSDDTVSNQRRLPDLEICRAGYLGQCDLSECLEEIPEGCEYAVHLGSTFYCRHPDRRKSEKSDTP